MSNLKDFFLLDPEIIFLNHGSFGATPRPVFEAYQRWQALMERQPVRFLATELMTNLRAARMALGAMIKVGGDDLAFVPNVTVGVNIVARSLGLKPGDEIITTNHEYGACDNIWEFVARKTGAKIVRVRVDLPAASMEDIAETVWSGVTPRTKVIFLSHITSATSLRMPIEMIGMRARDDGIITVIDGAHAPGHIPLDMGAIGADFYTGNGHKWLCAPKGSGFLWARPDRQSLIEPLVVSWGWGENNSFPRESTYLDSLQWAGTRDYSAYLSVPAAIDFQREHRWDEVGAACHAMAADAMRRIGEITGHAPLYPDAGGWYHQMATIPLPLIDDVPAFKARLYDEFKIEIPVVEWDGRPFLRLSVQGYNTAVDIDALVDAVRVLLKK